MLGEERSASVTFLNQVLRGGKDQAFVVQFDVRVKTLQGFTDSRQELAAALGRLQVPGQMATLLYSAVRESAESQMKKQKGRKAFILLTDGVAFRDHTSIGTAIEFAQRADTIIYTIRFSDPTPRFRPVWGTVRKAVSEHGKLDLERMARETSGTAYEVSANETIESIYAQIEDALRNQYSLGYTPLRAELDGKYRKVKLTAKNPHLVVHTRDGYYAE